MNQNNLDLNRSIKRENLFRQIRKLILDFALGACIVGLIPGLYTLRFVIVALLNVFMMWKIGRYWGFLKGQDILAYVGNLFGALGALGLAILSWLIVFGIGLFVPYVGSFALAIAFFGSTWMIGQATNQFYANGRRY